MACSQMWGDMEINLVKEKGGVESEVSQAPVTHQRVLTFCMALDLRWLLDTGETRGQGSGCFPCLQGSPHR